MLKQVTNKITEMVTQVDFDCEDSISWGDQRTDEAITLRAADRANTRNLCDFFHGKSALTS